MRFWLCLLLFVPFAAAAQDTQEERDVGFIQGLIEDNLSSVSSTVRIEGFEGALSSRATVAELTIADTQGVWLTATDLVFEWTRSDLLGGALNVSELSAGSIEIARPPVPEEQPATTEDLPTPETTPFALPELPVSIQIDRAAIDQIILGEALFGQAMVLRMESSVSLNGGAGTAELIAERIDAGPEGVFQIIGGFSNETRELTLDLTLREGENGIAANLMSLPGVPEIELTVKGTGPIADYLAEISLATADAERLGGEVTFITAEDGSDPLRSLSVDIGGDVTAILAPAYQPFFGDEVRLRALAFQTAEGNIVLDELSIAAQAIQLSGNARIAPDGWPEVLDLTGVIAAPDGSPVQLPIPTPTFTDRVELVLDYDATSGQRWTADFDIQGFDRPDMIIKALTLSGGGTIARGEGLRPGRVTAAMSYGAQSITLVDQALQQAIGSDVTGDFLIISAGDGPLWIDRLTLNGAGLEATLTALINGIETGFETDLSLAAEMESFERLQALTGLALTGGGSLDVEGVVVPLEAGFDLSVTVGSRDLGIGMAEVDPILRGEGSVFLKASRTEEGIAVDAFELATDLLSGTGSAVITSGSSLATFDLTLAEVREIIPRLTGPARMEGSATLPANGPVTFEMQVEAPGGVDAELSAEVVTHDAGSDLSALIAANIDEIGPYLALAGIAFEGAGSLNGSVTLPAGEPIHVVADVTGPGGLIASVDLSAPVDGSIQPVQAAASIELDDVAPYARLGDLPLSGPATLLSSVMIPTTGDASVLLNLEGPNGVSGLITAQSPDPRGFRPAQFGIEIAVEELRPFMEIAGLELEGAAAVSGSAQRSVDGPIALDLTVSGPGEAVVEVVGEVNPDDPEIPAQGRLQVQAESLAPYAALAGQDLNGAVNLGITGSAQIARLGLNVVIEGETSDLAIGIPTADLLLAGDGSLSARLMVDGVDQITVEGLQARYDAVQASGDAILSGSALSSSFAARLTDIGILSPSVSGDVNATGAVEMSEDGTLRLDVQASGAGGIDATVTATAGPGKLAEAVLDVQIAEVQPFAELAGLPLSGRASLAGTANRDANGLVVLDLTGAAPGDTQIELTGQINPDDPALPATGRLALRAASLAPYAALTGQDLRGGLAVTVVGSAEAGLGVVDVTVDGQTTALSIGIPTVDQLLRGNGVFSGRVARSADGIVQIDDLLADFNNFDVAAQTQLAGGAISTTFTARLRDIGLLAEGLSGAVDASGQITQRPGAGLFLDIDASGAGGVVASATGTFGTANQTDLAITGRVPLGLANSFSRSVRLDGNADLNLTLRGSPAVENLSGDIVTTDARLALPSVGRALEGVAARMTLSGGQARVTASAQASTGGAIEAQGTVGLVAPFNGDLTARASGVVIEDPALYSTTADATVSVVGPLTGGARISGQINLGQVDVRIPSSGFGALGDIPAITHFGDSAAVAQTRVRAGLTGESTTSGTGAASAGPQYPLDLTVSAPRRIFIRGRGLDTELGGVLRLAGTTLNIIPEGQFDLIRGRLNLLGQRIDFTEGSATLIGGFVPILRLVATTSRDDVDIRVIVAGPADAPDVTFESSPELPQDEVISQLIFGRSLTEISPLQAVQLASAVSTLAGRGGSGLVDGLREGFGLDDLDITTTDDGNAAVRAGAYLSENVYSDVVVGSDGTSEINLNLDLSDSVTVTGSAGSDGETSLGIFFQRDY